ncbi:MAG: hypothetical protein RJQ04_22385 [Longimicrobiales bacterium]
MLAQQELMELYRSLEDQPTLSVYVDGDQHDPAARSAWRTRLEGEVNRVRDALNGGDEAAFEAAWGRVWKEFRDYEEGFLPGAGMAAFATADRLVHVARFPVAPPTLVRWEQGLRAAPYVRVLKQERPVVVSLTDRERARLFRYKDADLHELPSLVADTAMGDLGEASVTKRGGRSSGRRGETATDQAQRILEVSADRLLAHVAQRLEEEAGAEGFLVLGGTQETIAKVHGNLSRHMAERAVHRASLHLEMPLPEVRSAVRAAASELTETLQEKLVDQVFDQARSGGKGALGRDATIEALRERRVDTLLLSRDFVSEDPDLADRCVGTAFAQGAGVEEVGGAQGSRLTQEAEGVAARLRFRIRSENGQEH